MRDGLDELAVWAAAAMLVYGALAGMYFAFVDRSGPPPSAPARTCSGVILTSGEKMAADVPC